MLEDKSLRWAHVGSFQSCHSVMNTHSALNTLPVCDDLPWLSTSCWREKKVTRNDSFPLGSQPILASLPMPRTQELSASQAAPVLPFTQPTQSQRGSCPNNTLQTRIYIFNTRRCHTGDKREDDAITFKGLPLCNYKALKTHPCGSRRTPLHENVTLYLSHHAQKSKALALVIYRLSSLPLMLPLQLGACI